MPYSDVDVEQDSLVAENIFLTIDGREILKGVTIKAVKGSITGLLGRNGAGKSTMLQSVFGVRRAHECDVFAGGKRVKRPYLTPGLLNYLPQFSFLPEGIALKKIARNYGADITEMLDFFPELEQELGKTPGELSGGNERLFSVLLLLLADVRFTLLDEPFSHLMPLYVQRLQDLIQRQKQKKGIVVTDHMYRYVLEACDMLYLVKDGKSLYLRDTNDLVLHGYLRQMPG